MASHEVFCVSSFLFFFCVCASKFAPLLLVFLRHRFSNNSVHALHKSCPTFLHTVAFCTVRRGWSKVLSHSLLTSSAFLRKAAVTAPMSLESHAFPAAVSLTTFARQIDLQGQGKKKERLLNRRSYCDNGDEGIFFSNFSFSSHKLIG